MQLADAKDVIEAVKDVGGATFPVLTPNLKVSCIFPKSSIIINL